MKKMDQIEEMNEWNQAASLIECGKSTFDEGTEKPSFRVGLQASRLFGRDGSPYGMCFQHNAKGIIPQSEI